MYPSVTTGLNGVVYQGYSHAHHGPWGQPLHCSGPSCHVHFGQKMYNISHPPLSPINYYQYLGPMVPAAHRQNDIIPLIEKSIDGEFSAIACYQQLINMAPTREQKEIITEIRKDEMRHLNTFSKIYSQLTGQKYNPKITEECPNKFKAGLNFAFHDEQKTVDHYLEISSKTDNEYIREQYKRAASDEQNHAVWFLYFLK